MDLKPLIQREFRDDPGCEGKCRSTHPVPNLWTVAAARPARRTEFILANTVLSPVAHVPEISLYVATEAVPLWEKTEEELGAIGLPPPFWAFAWAGGQALARYLLDRSDCVHCRRVLDVAAGSGLVGIAAARAGAAVVVGTEIDPFAIAAVELNASANGVYVEPLARDVLGEAPGLTQRFDLICIGDLFYEQDTAARAFALAKQCTDAGVEVLIGDPGRTYLPRERLRCVAEYTVPVTRELEDNDVKRTIVWTLR